MTPYAQRREARRLQRTIGATIFVVLLGASVGLRAGLLPAVGAIVGLLLLMLLVQWAVVLGQRRGAPAASCPALLSAEALRRVGMPVRAARAEGELSGRLRVTGDSLQWDPGAGAARLGARPIRWPRSTSEIRLQPLRGTIPLGHLEITDESGPVDVWLRDPAPVRAALNMTT